MADYFYCECCGKDDHGFENDADYYAGLKRIKELGLAHGDVAVCLPDCTKNKKVRNLIERTEQFSLWRNKAGRKW